MKFSGFMLIHAMTYIAFGIAFTLYAPLMLAFFAVPESLGNPIAYWQVVAFSRMFGAALLGFGLLLLAVRSFTGNLAPDSMRGILSAMLLANLLAAIVAITQQQAIWQTSAGWITVLLCGLFFAGYVYFYIQNLRGVE